MSLDNYMLKSYLEDSDLFKNGFIIIDIDTNEHLYFESEIQFKESKFPRKIKCLGSTKLGSGCIVIYCQSNVMQ